MAGKRHMERFYRFSFFIFDGMIKVDQANIKKQTSMNGLHSHSQSTFVVPHTLNSHRLKGSGFNPTWILSGSMESIKASCHSSEGSALSWVSHLSLRMQVICLDPYPNVVTLMSGPHYTSYRLIKLEVASS